MGIDDRDGNGQARRERELAGQTEFRGTGWRRRGPGTLSMILLWAVIGTGVYLGVRDLLPGFAHPRVELLGASEALLTPDRTGSYTIPGSINGVPITFMVDTGASTVSVSADEADRMRLVGCEGMAARTANGSAAGCMALAHEVDFGPFSARNVRVAVLPQMIPGTALLGMDLLSQLDMIQRDGHLLLRASAARSY